MPGHSTLLAITASRRPCRVPSVALMASAPKGNCAGPVGIGVHNRVCRDNSYHRPPRHDPQLLVDRCRQCALSAAYGNPWSGARKFEAKKVPILLALVGVSVWLVACSIGPN